METSLKIIEFYQDNAKLSNKDIYTKFMKTFCKAESEESVIDRIRNDIPYNENSFIRIRNDLISKWLLEANNPEERIKKEKEVRSEYSPINDIISAFKRYFN